MCKSTRALRKPSKCLKKGYEILFYIDQTGMICDTRIKNNNVYKGSNEVPIRLIEQADFIIVATDNSNIAKEIMYSLNYKSIYNQLNNMDIEYLQKNVFYQSVEDNSPVDKNGKPLSWITYPLLNLLKIE
ncbi:hypothetical protein [Lysinibacillus fusiformis]|uniref:hypothetical protein n=1 Tax=Lysinibacillus fusiformis TaxID=28031 RepID=UPI001E41EF8A|nr:hypothetical protein [Lysinibacillus fusiformis]